MMTVSGPVIQASAMKELKPDGLGSFSVCCYETRTVNETPATPGHRLRPSQRMHTAGDFSSCMRSGRRINGNYYRLCVLFHTDESTQCPARIGFAISRKVDKRAVIRNRLKRVARNVFRQQPSLLPGDYIFMAKTEAATADGEALSADLARLLQRLSR
jgi:ribonuclease P protein component